MATKVPLKKRQSVWKVYGVLAPVFRSVPVPPKFRSALAITPLKSVMVDGSKPAKGK